MINDQLDAIYATLPRIECKGLCQASCHSAGMAEAEWNRISLTLVRGIPEGDGVNCFLLQDGKCSVYEIRPTVCRLWGAIVDDDLMRCPHGCIPDRWLGSYEGWKLLEQVRSLK